MGKLKIFMGIPSTGDRSDAQVYFLRSIEKKYKEEVELVYPEDLVIRVSHDFARNAYVDAFLSSDCDLLWFLDSDVVPPKNVLDTVVKHHGEWSLAGAPYPVFISQKGLDGPQVVYTVYNRNDKGFYPSPIPGSGQSFVDGLATGCLFIKREVFTKLSKPYFEHKYDNQTRELTEGEDLGFCRKVSDLGYKFFVDFSHVCKHYKRVDLLDVNNYAITYANNQVLAYDASLRQSLAKRHIKSLTA